MATKRHKQFIAGYDEKTGEFLIMDEKLHKKYFAQFPPQV
jgi:hypothetical protein